MEDILVNLTDSQKSTLKQFRLNLEEFLTEKNTDYVLVKFLRARNFNLKLSEKIFKENYYNRILFGIDDILETYKKPEVVRKYESCGILGFAKDGSLIRYVGSGRLDFYGFIMSMSTTDLTLYFAYLIEGDIKMLKDRSLETGKLVQEITYVCDLEGFTIQQVMHKNVIEVCMDYIRLVQDCYPELWSSILIVNAPKIFEKAFNLFKPVIRGKALERIKMADKESTKHLLLKYIDENVLPTFLGGLKVDSNGDPECKEFIKFGGKIPEKYYGQNTTVSLSPLDPDVTCFTIGPRSMRNISFQIHEANTRMRVILRTENGSVSMAILYKEFGPDPQNIQFPKEDEYLDETADNFKYKQVSVEMRSQTDSIQEDSTTTFPFPGIYVLRLSNATSWFTSRRLVVKTELLAPVKGKIT